MTFQQAIVVIGASAGGVESLRESCRTASRRHGALVKLREGDMVRYRCHTGHAYSDSALLEGVIDSTGEMLWQVMRSLEEGTMLLQQMGATCGTPEI